ncbi:MazG-like family protein [Herpetosiphon llansteffanensis]|uniref:MazG-like family protein n=1 Tax=Herpetosiphon llansteffanensis TaxID=2094568 RepID=UPI000D7C1967|nr:MazG-like family protein [Herpetosiphon llansteffanensis]
MSQADILAAIAAERQSQDSKWGEQNHHLIEWLSILMEEVGEVAQAINEYHWRDASMANIRKELIQVAAVAVSALESIERNYPSADEE